jgi:negative regulator of sigma E activity
MSPAEEPLTPFERSARAVLEESVLRIDGRTRSRLNQARHAALEVAARPRPAWWRSLAMMPAAGAAAAAVLVAVMLWHPQSGGELAEVDGQHAVEDLDLLADGEALDLVEKGDGSFYEWAAAQNEASGESDG